MNDPEVPSPYTAPSAPLENNAPAGDQSLTPRALSYLLASRKWMQLSAIAFCALILPGLTNYAVTVALYWEVIKINLTAPVVIAVLYVGFILCTVPSLLRCASNVRDAKNGGDDRVALALQTHRKFWRRLGLGILTVFGISILALLVFTTGM